MAITEEMLTKKRINELLYELSKPATGDGLLKLSEDITARFKLITEILMIMNKE